MKQRIFCALLAALMLLSAAACGDRYRPAKGEALPQSPFSVTPANKSKLALPFNAVWRLFGGTDTEHCLVYRFGNEPTYYEWMARKIAWTDDTQYLGELKAKIIGFPQTDNGYLWSWGTSVYWPTGKGELHYDGTLRYVSAAAEILRWTGDIAFLDETDGDTYGEDRLKDASEGRSVYEKCKAAMAFAANEMDGKNGVITLTEKAAFLADGVTRFDRNAEGELVWNNTGLPGSASSNYWDNLCFGHRDAYETALYYHALKDMADIERMRGDTAAAESYETAAATVHAAFDETFWDEEKGRYIACVDAGGTRRDPGLTFLNTEALAYGLGDAEKAERIVAWLDGERTVEGDTLTGREIYDYAAVLNRVLGGKTVTKTLYFAPVTNTLRIEDVSGTDTPWWFSLEGAINVGEGGNAAFGRHLENGGYIFYTVYYELTARATYKGAGDVQRRAKELAAVYRFNGFNSDEGLWAEGLTGEFPENGLVSRVFVTSLAGIDASADALEIRPALPKGVKTLGVQRLAYRGSPLTATVGTNTLTLTAQTPLRGTLRFCPQTPGEYTAVLTDANDNQTKRSVSTDENGYIPLTMDGYTEIKITP